MPAKGDYFMYGRNPLVTRPTTRTIISNTCCLAALIVTLGLTGCAGMQAREDQQAQQVINTIRAVCNGYGYKEGTPQFASCAQAQAAAIYGTASAPPAAPGSCFGYCGPGGSSAPAPSASGYQQGTHTYIINGRTVMCTTTGTITNCN